MACVPEMAALESAFFTVLPQESQRDFPWFAPKMCLFNFTSSFSSASVQVERLLYWLLQPSVTSRCAQRCFPLTRCPNLRCAWSYSCRYSNHLTGRLTYRTGHTGTLKSAHQWVVSTSFWNLHREFSEKCMVHIACPRGRLTLGSWYWRLCLSATFKWLSKLSLTQQCFCIHTRSSFYNVFWAADLGIQCLLFTCASWFEKDIDSFEKKHDVRVFLALAFFEIICCWTEQCFLASYVWKSSGSFWPVGGLTWIAVVGQPLSLWILSEEQMTHFSLDSLC